MHGRLGGVRSAAVAAGTDAAAAAVVVGVAQLKLIYIATVELVIAETFDAGQVRLFKVIG